MCESTLEVSELDVGSGWLPGRERVGQVPILLSWRILSLRVLLGRVWFIVLVLVAVFLPGVVVVMVLVLALERVGVSELGVGERRV
jgi:hypothetical protein